MSRADLNIIEKAEKLAEEVRERWKKEKQKT